MILSTSKLNAKQYLMNENVTKGGLLTLWFTFEELISIIVVQRLIEVYTERDDDKMKMEMSVTMSDEAISQCLENWGYGEERIKWFVEMRNLIPVEEDKTVSGRKLHEVLKVGRDYSTWMKQQFISLCLVEGEHFDVTFKGDVNIAQEEVENMSPQQRSRHGISVDYILTLDTAKNICMVTGTAPKTNEETKKISQDVRDYFIMTEETTFKSMAYQIDLERRVTKNAIKRAQAATKARNEAWEVQGTRREIIDEYDKLVSMLDYDSLPREVKAQLAKIDMLRELTGNNWTTH